MDEKTSVFRYVCDKCGNSQSKPGLCSNPDGRHISKTLPVVKLRYMGKDESRLTPGQRLENEVNKLYILGAHFYTVFYDWDGFGTLLSRTVEYRGKRIAVVDKAVRAYEEAKGIFEKACEDPDTVCELQGPDFNLLAYVMRWRERTQELLEAVGPAEVLLEKKLRIVEGNYYQAAECVDTVKGIVADLGKGALPEWGVVYNGISYESPIHALVTIRQEEQYLTFWDAVNDVFVDARKPEYQKKFLAALGKAGAGTSRNPTPKYDEDKYTPYCSLRAHAKRCGVADTIFQNANRWKSLKNTGLSKKHGQYQDWSFRWDDLLPLVQAHDIQTNKGARTMDELRKKYRMH